VRMAVDFLAAAAACCVHTRAEPEYAKQARAKRAVRDEPLGQPAMIADPLRYGSPAKSRGVSDGSGEPLGQAQPIL
jgi:hypothetical protein